MDPRSRLVVAIDKSDRDDILTSIDSLSGVVGWVKLGLQAFVSNGPQLIREVVTRDLRLFLDLKFHDIPNTASHAVQEAVNLGVGMTNVHAAGGPAMLTACAAAVASSSTILLGVTVLTSLSDDDLHAVGYSGTSEENVLRMARLCRDSGLNGVVASPLEITSIREACGGDFVILTPGIRSAEAPADDQKRTLSPREAITRGATYIVVGRPITAAADPVAAARRIVDEIS
jgi:orotidine-5'-phosphate decarboxylase